MRKKFIIVSFIFIFALFSVSPFSVSAITIPRTGIHLSHYKVINGSLDGTSIALTYQNPGVREIIRNELSSLKSQKVQTIRLIVWFMHDTTGHNWGVIPSNTGRVTEPYRTNLAQFFSDIRDSGIPNLIVVMGPMWANNPVNLNLGYNSTLMEEDWSFIQDIRNIAKTNGPVNGVTFDLSNEIGPQEGIKSWTSNNGLPANGPATFNAMMAYITEIWKRYVNAYGSKDASFGSVANSRLADQYDSKSLINLISALRQANVAMPEFYPMSLYTDSSQETYDKLIYVDTVLKNNNIAAPIRITESYYDYEPTVIGVKQFVVEDRRPILDFLYWPLKHGVDTSNLAGWTSEGPPFNLTEYPKYFIPNGIVTCNPPVSPVNQTNNLATSIVTGSSHNVNLIGYGNNPAVQVCVSTPSTKIQLMTAWFGDTNSYPTTVPWIVPGVNYTFSLFAVPQNINCQGTLLSACTVIGQKMGDINLDGKIDIQDLLIIKNDFGKSTGFNSNADLNKDNKVDLKDLVILAKDIR